MRTRIEPSEWLDEEVDNLARVGLRTLVVAYKTVAESVFGLRVPILIRDMLKLLCVCVDVCMCVCVDVCMC